MKPGDPSEIIFEVALWFSFHGACAQNDMCCQLQKCLFTDCWATFFSQKLIVIVNTCQVTYSVFCMNMNYTSALAIQCGQANSISPFYRSFTSDTKTKEQGAVRTITRTQDFIHACSQANNHVPVLQPFLIILNLLCCLKRVKRVCNAEPAWLPDTTLLAPEQPTASFLFRIFIV